MNGIKAGRINRALALRATAVCFAVAWIFLVLLGYYSVHKPFGVQSALAMLSAAGDILVVLCLYLLAACLGHRLLARMPFASSIEALTFEIGIGLGATSFSVFALGLVGLLNRWLLWTLLIVMLVVLRSDIRASWAQVRALSFRIETNLDRVLACFVLLTFLLAAVSSLAPTLAWDAQLYHLYEGKIWLEQGKISAPPDVMSFSDPALIEMLYLAAMALKGDGGAGLVHLGYAVLLAGALAAATRRWVRDGDAWLTVALVMSVPSFVLVSSWPYNDAALAFYAFAAFYALMRSSEGASRSWLVLSGLFAGLALGTKYTAIFVPIALVITFVYIRQRAGWRELPPLIVPAVLVAAPWYLRNWIFTGNPIYPFLFGGRYWDTFRGFWYSHLGSGLIAEPWRLLTVPWEATILGQEGSTSFEATIGPLLLMLLPLALLLRRGERKEEDGTLAAAGVFVVAFYVQWLVGAAASRGFVQSRLLFPIFPTLALLIGAGFARLSRLDLSGFSLARFARIVLVIVLGLTILGQSLEFTALNPMPVLAGQETREHFLSARLTQGYWDALQFLGTQNNPRVLFLWEPRAYYTPPGVAVQTDEILDMFPHLRNQFGGTDGISRALRAEGYTHILIARWGMEFAIQHGYAGAKEADIELLSELVSRHARQVYGTRDLSYSTDAEGNVQVAGVEVEPYSVYELTD